MTRKFLYTRPPCTILKGYIHHYQCEKHVSPPGLEPGSLEHRSNAPTTKLRRYPMNGRLAPYHILIHYRHGRLIGKSHACLRTAIYSDVPGEVLVFYLPIRFFYYLANLIIFTRSSRIPCIFFLEGGFKGILFKRKIFYPFLCGFRDMNF